MKKVYHITMSILFLAMAVAMILAEKLKLQTLLQFSSMQRYVFGGICLLYGGFRLIRAFNRNDF